MDNRALTLVFDIGIVIKKHYHCRQKKHGDRMQFVWRNGVDLIADIKASYENVQM